MSHGRARKLFTGGHVPFHVDVSGARAEMACDFDLELTAFPASASVQRPGLSLVYGFYFRSMPFDWSMAGSQTDRGDYVRNGEDFLHYHLGSRSLCSSLSAALGMPVVSRSGLVDEGDFAAVVEAACRNSRLMPSLPGMPAVWSTLGELIGVCTSGGDVGDALVRAVREMSRSLDRG